MRRVAVLAALLVAPAAAQTIGTGAAPTQVGAQGSAGTTTTCVDVRIGDARAYDCLNQRLRDSVPQRRYSAADAPYASNSPPHVVGTFNEAATRQLLGNSFGRSVIPQRPASAFGGPNPLAAGRSGR